MKKKMELYESDMRFWMRETWFVYASQSYEGKLLRIYVSPDARYRVVHGEKKHYEGGEIRKALKAWEEV